LRGPADGAGVEAVERLARRLDEQRRAVRVPPGFDDPGEVAHQGRAGFARILLEELQEENPVSEALQPVEPLEDVHALAATAEARGAGQVFDDDQGRHEPPPLPSPGRARRP